jgi:hypothetical protein
MLLSISLITFEEERPIQKYEGIVKHLRLISVRFLLERKIFNLSIQSTNVHIAIKPITFCMRPPCLHEAIKSMYEANSKAKIM